MVAEDFQVTLRTVVEHVDSLEGLSLLMQIQDTLSTLDLYHRSVSTYAGRCLSKLPAGGYSLDIQQGVSDFLESELKKILEETNKLYNQYHNLLGKVNTFKIGQVWKDFSKEIKTTPEKLAHFIMDTYAELCPDLPKDRERLADLVQALALTFSV
ncbi:MAG: hypothetical protein ACYCQJ_15745 [Nitrososphaerales archaeon]